MGGGAGPGETGLGVMEARVVGEEITVDIRRFPALVFFILFERRHVFEVYCKHV